MDAQVAEPTRPRRTGYPGTTVAAAAIATLFFPVLSLIAALALIGGQDDVEKRRQLKFWAFGSAGWLALQVVIGLALLAAFSFGGGVSSERSGPCVGGPELGAAGKDISGDGTRVVVPCAISGSETVSFSP